MILISQSYSSDSPEHDGELTRCRELNENSGIFERVEYLDGKERRLSFNDLMSHCLRHYRGKLCVIANSDILFGSSTYSLSGLRKEGRLVTLTRWENASGPRFIGFTSHERFFSGSQDAWAFVSGSIPVPDSEIPLGVVGCDSAIAGWAADAGVEVVNPSLSIRTTHMHAQPAQREEGGPAMCGFFGYPEMTSLNTTGDVLCHNWPSESGEWEFNWQLLATRK